MNRMKLEDRASVALSTRIRIDLLKRMERVAERKDWSMSQLIRNALEEFVEKNNRKNGH